MRRGAVQPGNEGGAIVPWRFVVGALLHLIVPAWLLALAVGWFASPPLQASRAAVLGALATRSLMFLFAYAALILVAGLLAAVLDPWLRARRRRREAADPAALARASSARLEAALASAAPVLAGDRAAAAALARLRTAPLDHTDPRARQVGAHIAEAAQSFGRALAAAAPDRRAGIAADAARTLAHLAAAADALAADPASAAEEEASRLARFVELRYAPDPALDLSRSHSG